MCVPPGIDNIADSGGPEEVYAEDYEEVREVGLCRGVLMEEWALGGEWAIQERGSASENSSQFSFSASWCLLVCE